MKRILVTGGCGFIGANFVRLAAGDLSRRRDHQPRRPDLRRQPRQPRGPRGRAALPVRPRRRRRPARWSSSCWPRGSTRSSTSPPRATSTARSTTPRRSSGPTSSAPSACSTPPAPPASRGSSRSRPTRSTARSARRPAVHRDDPAGAQQPVRRQQGRRRPARPRRAPHARHGHGHHPLLEQLRPVPVPREADPAVHHQRPGRHARCRSTATAGRSATGSTSPTTAGASTPPCGAGRPGEVYNFGGRSERFNIDVTRAVLAPDRQARDPDPPRHRPPRPRPPLRRRLLPRRGRAGLAPDRRLRGRASPRPSTGTATTPEWVERVRSGAYRIRD